MVLEGAILSLPKQQKTAMNAQAIYRKYHQQNGYRPDDRAGSKAHEVTGTRAEVIAQARAHAETLGDGWELEAIVTDDGEVI